MAKSGQMAPKLAQVAKEGFEEQVKEEETDEDGDFHMEPAVILTEGPAESSQVQDYLEGGRQSHVCQICDLICTSKADLDR